MKFLISQKGVSLYLALMTMFILLAIGLGISLIIVSQMKMIRGMEDSVVAFYATDTGIERILYEDKNCRQSGCPSPPCYFPEIGCGFSCRPDCWMLLENANFTGNLDTDINYESTHTYCPDFNGNGIVDYCGDCAICPGDDVCIIREHFGERPTSPNWDIKFDFDGNGIIEIQDVFVVYDKRGFQCSGYNNFKSKGEFRDVSRAIEVVR